MFLTKYPKIKLSITNVTDSVNLTNNILDVIISESDISDGQFNKDYLCSIKRGVFAAKEYLIKHGKPEKIVDLKKHNCLVYTYSSPSQEWVFSGNRKIKIEGNYMSSASSNIISMAVTGLGLMWSPILTVANEVKSGKLVEVKLEASPVLRKLYVYHRPTNNNNIRLLIRHLQEHLSKLA